MLWVSMKDCLFVPNIRVEGVGTINPQRIEMMKKNVRNMLIFALSKNARNALQILHEGTEDVKQSKSRNLTVEYELFHMEPGEIVESMHTRIICLIIKVENLGKKF